MSSHRAPSLVQWGMIRSLLPLLVLAACGGDDPDDPSKSPPTMPAPTTPVHTGTSTPSPTGDTGTDLPTLPSCLNEVLDAFPDDGATDAYYRTTVEFFLAESEPAATVALSGPGGPVSGQVSVVDRRVIFTPNAPLDPSTAYSAVLDWSCPDETVQFTTSPLGTPVDPAVLVGGAWRLDLANGRWIEPPNLGKAAAALVGADVLLGVVSADASAVEVIFARTDGIGGPQDLCEPTTPFPLGDFTDNPAFQVGPETVDLPMSSALVPIEGLVLSGAFSADASFLEGGRLQGLIDTAALVQLLNPGQDPDALCDLLAPLGVSCEPCPGSGLTTCAPIDVDSVRGQREAAPVQVRSLADIAADGACP